MFAIFDRWTLAYVFTFAAGAPRTVTFDERLDAATYATCHALDDLMPDGAPRYTIERLNWDALTPAA